MNIDKIITESINKVLKEVCEIDNAPNGWHSWAETDAENGMTPEEGKAIRMQPGNAARAKEPTPVTTDFSKRPTVEEWEEVYKPMGMKYGDYCEKIYGVKLR